MMAEKNDVIPEGVQTLARLSGETAETLWEGTGRLPGLKAAVDTPAKIETFDRIVRETEARLKGTASNAQIAIQAISRAGEAILGPDRPARPGSVADFLDQAVASGILQRVPAREPAPSRPLSGDRFDGLLRRS